MLRRLAGRTAAVVAIVGATIVGVVWTSGPAQAAGPVTPFTGYSVEYITKTLMYGSASEAASGTAGASPSAMRAVARCGIAPTPGCVAAGIALTAATMAVASCVDETSVCQETVMPWTQNLLNKIFAKQIQPDNTCEADFSPALSDQLGKFYEQRDTNVWGSGRNVLTAVISYKAPRHGDGLEACFARYEVQYRCFQTPGTVRTYTSNATSVTPTTGLRNLSIGNAQNLCSNSGNKLLEAHFIPNPSQDTIVTPRIDWQDTPSTVEAATQIICQRPDGTTYEVPVETPDAKEAVRIGKCNPGDRAIGVKGQVGTDQGTKIPAFDIDLTVPPEDVTAYPLCAGAACLYRLVVNGQECVAGMAACFDWTRKAQTHPGDYKCYYGPYELPLSECYWLERRFEWEPNKVTELNTDGNPDTYTDPAPNPGTQPTNSATASPTPRPTVTTAPAPTVAPTPVPGYCASPYALGPVLPEAAALANNLGPRFSIQVVGGYRESDPYPDHPSGKALDFMVGSDSFTGQRLASYAQQNAASLGIDYIMWDHHIWSQARSAEGWRDVADRGSPTANHEDHVHITVLQTGASVPCSSAGEPVPENGECFPSGWGALNPVEWVVKPLKCAFIPRQDLKTRAGQTRTKLEGKGPAPILAAIGARVGDLGDAGGCSGPTIQFNLRSVHQSIQPFAACTEPLSTVATFSRALTTVAIAIGGVGGLARAVSAGFGFNFTLGRGGRDGD